MCRHHFCRDCFSRFISGSLSELDRNLRCCICGKISSLTEENQNDKILLKFGRDKEPRSINPVALTTNEDNDFIVPDAGKKRILIFHKDGQPKNDFAYVSQRMTFSYSPRLSNRSSRPVTKPTASIPKAWWPSGMPNLDRTIAPLRMRVDTVSYPRACVVRPSKCPYIRRHIGLSQAVRVWQPVSPDS